MDWIQDRLARLIEEGKRALSREVVVMSDARKMRLTMAVVLGKKKMIVPSSPSARIINKKSRLPSSRNETVSSPRSLLRFLE